MIAGRYVTEDNDAWEEKFLNTVWKTDSAIPWTDSGSTTASDGSVTPSVCQAGMIVCGHTKYDVL